VMNVAHAATIILYELSQVEHGGITLASPETLSRLRESASSLLVEVNYPTYKREFKTLMLQRIFGRAELTEREANTLLGMIKLLRWHLSSHKTTKKEDASSKNQGESPDHVPEIVNCRPDQPRD
jgi:tRNA/rRNA methyltransferase